MTNPTDKLAELRNKVTSTVNHAKYNVGFVPDPEQPEWGKNLEIETGEIMSAFATYLEQIVAEQWPEEKRSAYTCQQPDGFNEALDQTAAILREEARKLRGGKDKEK